MNTQFKVGQQFKDKSGNVIIVHSITNPNSNSFQCITLKINIMDADWIHSLMAEKLQSLIIAGELTEVVKLTGLQMFLKDVIESDIDTFKKSYLIDSLESYINEEKNENNATAQ